MSDKSKPAPLDREAELSARIRDGWVLSSFLAAVLAGAADGSVPGWATNAVGPVALLLISHIVNRRPRMALKGLRQGQRT